MMRVVALTFALSAASATALGAFRSNAFLSSDMRPDMVAKSLQAVEGEWMAQAHVAAECQTQGALRVCEEAPRAFHKSCSTVVRAVMMGSQGDSIKVSEYMTSVCSQKTISGWHQSVCGFLGQSMVAKMSANPADNRENHVAKADATCNGLWLRFVQEQTAKVAVEVAKAKADEVAKAQMAEAAKLEVQAKAKADEVAKAQLAEAEASQKRVEDAKIAAIKSVETQVVKQADSTEANIKAASKSALEAKVKDAGKTADAKIAADAKAADAKKQKPIGSLSWVFS